MRKIDTLLTQLLTFTYLLTYLLLSHHRKRDSTAW